MIHFIGKISVVSLGVLLICGCATGGVPNTWKNKAGFYDSNYPNITKNNKAKMIIDRMKFEGKVPIVEEREIITKVIVVYNESGTQIWPTEEIKNKANLSNIGDRLEELGSVFENKMRKNDNI